MIANPAQAINYYLALLAVQMAILGFVIAGIVTLMQILQNAKPRRDIRLLISQTTLVTYIGFLAVLSFLLGVGSWSVGMLQSGLMYRFFLRPEVGLVLLIACLYGLVWFLLLVYRARRLLQADEYLEAYLLTIKPEAVRDYLFAAYSIRPDGSGSGSPVLDLAHKASAAKSQDLMKHLKVWDRRYSSVKDAPDPFQPVRDYLKDCAFKYDEFGSTQALGFYDELFGSAYTFVAAGTDSQDYYYLGRYVADSATEFFNIFRKMSSEKHKESIIRILQEQGMRFTAVNTTAGLPPIIRALETIANMADDDEIILCVIAIHELTDEYLKQHSSVSWEAIASVFEDACSSVTRLAENYYLQPENPLRTVPIMSYYTGEYRNVTAELVSFFLSYQDLGDRYVDTYPLHYFEAIEAVLESMFARYGEIVEAGQAGRGLNVAYHHFARNLYNIYQKVGIDAIEHQKPELLALVMSNLRRIVKPAKNFGLHDEHAEIVAIIIELGMKGTSSMGDIAVKADGRKMSFYIVETLTKHGNTQLIKRSLDNLTNVSEIDLTKTEIKHLLAELRKM
jgi:hypothetical protein